jgi:hypothetical protein
MASVPDRFRLDGKVAIATGASINARRGPACIRGVHPCP